MRFKILGILLLVAAAYLAVAALAGAEQQHNDALSLQVQPLVAIFLLLLVRILQAEKHHRDLMKKAAVEPEEKILQPEEPILEGVLNTE